MSDWKKKIIVMGGSFNPPTVAHLKLMQSAIAQLSTGDFFEDIRGVFVPSSDAYVRRKMSRKSEGADHTVLPEKMRLDMLKSFHELDHHLFVDDRELGTENVKGHTVDTLCAIQQENPNAQVYFIFGGDKLEGLPRWGSYEPLVSQFKVIIFGRNGLDAKQTIKRIPELAQYSDSFIVLQQPEGLDGISSTAVREKIRKNERVDDMLTPDVYTMLLAERKKKDNTILCFQGDYHFLSNFHCAQFSWDFWPYWDSAEAAFQSAKCTSDEERRKFTELSVTPAESKRMGRQVQLRSDWEQVKDGIMEEIVHAKFFQIEPFARKLMATGNAELIEGNIWGDTYWGVDLHTMQGQNKLGKILMKIRDELNAIPPELFKFKVKTPYVDAWANDDIMDMVVKSWADKEKRITIKMNNMSDELRQQIKNEEEKRKNRSLPVSIGTNAHQEPINIDMEKIGCVIIYGSVGYGKTTLCRNIMIGLQESTGNTLEYFVLNDNSSDEYADIQHEMTPDSYHSQAVNNPHLVKAEDQVR